MASLAELKHLRTRVINGHPMGEIVRSARKQFFDKNKACLVTTKHPVRDVSSMTRFLGSPFETMWFV